MKEQGSIPKVHSFLTRNFSAAATEGVYSGNKKWLMEDIRNNIIRESLLMYVYHIIIACSPLSQLARSFCIVTTYF